MSQASLILAVDDQALFGKKLDETVTNVNYSRRNRHSLPILESLGHGLYLWRSHNVSKISLENNVPLPVTKDLQN